MDSVPEAALDGNETQGMPEFTTKKKFVVVGPIVSMPQELGHKNDNFKGTVSC